MKHPFRHIACAFLAAACLCTAGRLPSHAGVPAGYTTGNASLAGEDSIPPRYSVRKTAPEVLDDLEQPPADLRNPENIKTEVEYNEESNLYIIGTKAGENYIDVPLYLTPEEYAEAHIPQAINVPNEEIGEDAIAELQDKDQLILIYCRSGNRSKQAAEKLAAQGYTNIVEFGGIHDWDGETVAS